MSQSIVIQINRVLDQLESLDSDHIHQRQAWQDKLRALLKRAETELKPLSYRHTIGRHAKRIAKALQPTEN